MTIPHVFRRFAVEEGLVPDPHAGQNLTSAVKAAPQPLRTPCFSSHFHGIWDSYERVHPLKLGVNRGSCRCCRFGSGCTPLLAPAGPKRPTRFLRGGGIVFDFP